MNQTEVVDVLTQIHANFPRFEINDTVVCTWAKMFEDADALIGRRALQEMFKVVKMTPTPSDFYRECQRLGAFSKAPKQPDSKAQKLQMKKMYCEAYDEKQEILLFENHNGHMVTFAEPKENCVQIGSFTWNGKDYPFMIPKIDFVLRHMGGHAVDAALKEILPEGKSWSEMLKDKLWIPLYRKKLDELVALVQYTFKQRAPSH